MQEENIGSNAVFTEKASFTSVALKVFSILKKHWKIETIVAAVIVIVVLVFMAIPVVGVGGLKLVNLNSSVRLESGQKAKLKSGDVSVEVTHFTNETCPTGQTCFGNAKSVEYMLTVDGQKYATGSMNTNNASDYRIKTVLTDYKTYAEIEITKLK